ncbi:hypothetical protein H4S02_004577 [Coemansia sp. RSA 2611]|nr:hypothetical protein H4S02_004577 [Coemansia sp. RSA 2611]
MTTINDVPGDILRHISTYELSASGKETNPLNDWKNSLLFLCICSSWRTAAKGLLYSRAVVLYGDEFIYGPEAKEPDDDISTVRTNVELIVQNGDAHAVTWLHITIKELGFLVYPLMNVVRSLAIGEDERAGLKALEARLYPNRVREVSDSEYCAAARDYSVAISRRLPNVRVIDIDAPCYDEVLANYLDTLIGSYADQLHDITCKSILYCPMLQPAAQLQYVDLRVDYREEMYVPPICPGILKRLRMCCRGFEFLWEYLLADKELNIVRFDHLETLYLLNIGVRYFYGDDFVFELEFPRLTDLTLAYINMQPTFAKCLARAPLKRLVLEGDLSNALVICKQLPRSLKELFVWFDSEDYLFSDEHIASEIYELLPYLRGIPNIICEFLVPDCPIDVSRLDLSHITFLQLHADMDLNALIDKIPSMTNMTGLNIMISGFDNNQAPSVIAKLMGLRQRYSVPLPSKIRKLFLYFYMAPAHRDALITALEELRWWLPQLETLKLPEY